MMPFVRKAILSLVLAAFAAPAAVSAQFLNYALNSQRANDIRHRRCATNETMWIKRCGAAAHHGARHARRNAGRSHR